MPEPDHSDVRTAVDALAPELVDLRRDLHAHPELAWQEERTTAIVADRLGSAGIDVQLLPKSGLVAEVGAHDGPVVALRADLDALAVDDLTTEPWTSTVPGTAHACGHDVHTAALVGAGLALAELHRATPLAGRVRMLFQPAEEVMPGGALELISAGARDGVSHVFGLHCDPGVDVGVVGLREGPMTGAADALTVRLTGRGDQVGHQADVAGPVLARHRHRPRDAGVRQQLALDFAQLDPVAAHLDLVIHPAQKLQLSVRSIARAVARAIQPLTLAKRRGHKALRRQSGSAQISAR